jgi:hypothetical protein
LDVGGEMTFVDKSAAVVAVDTESKLFSASPIWGRFYETVSAEIYG